MYKFLKNLGLSLTLLAGAETATLPDTNILVKPAQAQETVKKGLLQLSLKNKGIGNVSICIDGQEMGDVYEDSPKIIKLNYDSYIISIKNYNSILDQKAIEIKKPTSSLEILIDTSGHAHFGDFTNFFNKDNDNYFDDVEQFFGTDDNNSQDNPGTRANFIVKKNDKDYIFYTQNYNYIPTFLGSKFFIEDMQAYDNQIKELEKENSNKFSEIYSLNNRINRIERSPLVSLIVSGEDEDDARSLKKELESLENRYNWINTQIQKLKEEKDKKCNDFLSNSNVFWFNRNGDSLKIFYKKYEDKEWKDISAQPDFYKNLK